MDRELSRIKNMPFSCRRAIKDLTRGVHSKDSQWIEVAIENLSSIQKISRWVKVAIESYQECDKKRLKGLNRQHNYQKVSRSYQDCLKTVFQRREKHRYKYNKACYTNQDPNNILSSQNRLSTKNVKHMDPKHTHTLNKSNQFYISKTSQDSLVSIH